jgi:SAM-dependent methyltransferase
MAQRDLHEAATSTNGAGRDKFQLYQDSVQNPAYEVRFLRRRFHELRGREALRLREDFCGSALLASEWVRRVPRGLAIGIDLDGPTLQYAREHNVARLTREAQARIELVRADVRSANDFGPDIVVAFNFSYFVFKTRPLLRRYFEGVYRSLARDGVFFLDIYGGPEAQVVQEEESEQDGFTYVWHQARFNPISHETLCHIHFDFPDGSRMHRAFTYDWRLWSLPEVLDLLGEVGFEAPEVYWEGTDRKAGGGNGVFRKSLKGDNAASWIAYVAARK